jgi:hypothetical protein
VDRCDECGFAYDLDRATFAGAAVVEQVAVMTEVLVTVPQVERRRSPRTWSPLEYGCHTRDVLLVQRERVLLARRAHRPAVESMGRDERVDHDGYAEQDRIDVVRQLTDAAGLFANVLGRLGEADWERTVMYNYPAPTERSLRWVAVHTVHEVVHHLLDIRRQATAA